MDFVLRPLRPSDLQNLIDLDSDPEVMRYISGGPPPPDDVMREVILPKMLSWEKPGEGFFALHVGESFAGWVHLRPDRFEPSWIEVGYRLKRAYWGHGIATRATKDLIRQGFALGYDVVTARTLVDNRASRRVMEKAGMTYEGDFTYPPTVFGDWVIPGRDAVLYAIRRG